MSFDIEIENGNDKKVEELLSRLHEIEGKLESKRNERINWTISNMGLAINPENEKKNDPSIYIELLSDEKERVIKELKELGLTEMELKLHLEILDLRGRIGIMDRNIDRTSFIVMDRATQFELDQVTKKLKTQRNIIIGVLGVLIPLVIYVVM